MAAHHISPFSGSWYPGNAGDLERLLDERFAQSCRRTGPYLLKDAVGFVVPHAGPAWSGTVAAAVYRTIQQLQPERVVVLGFPHHGGLGGIAIPDVDSIETPLGEVRIGGEIDGGTSGRFRRAPEGQLCDHSIEIQLPFLQRVAPQARVTALYVGHMEAEERRAVAGVLAEAWRPGTVFLASSDFTHFGPSFGYTPFPAEGAAARLRTLDFDCMDAAGSLDAAIFLETLRERDATVCGRDPIALLLDVLHLLGGDGIYQAVLDYQTSGEIEGDYRHSVSYAALGYARRESFELDGEDREALLEIAEATLRRLRESGVREAAPVPAGRAALEARRGIFVSLHQGSELLGCIGNCSNREALSAQVGELVLSAALEDTRFRPAAEAAGPIDIEISVLTPFRRIRGAGQLCVGRHGAALKLGSHLGLLLPQVAEERGWTAEKFLDALARKSLLAPGAWRDPKARLSVFEAQVFSRPG